MKSKKIKKRICFLLAILLIVLTGVLIWKSIRSSCAVSCQSGAGLPPSPYAEQDRVMKAISLSYLVYGCETCEGLTGTVSELLDANRMGIIAENFGIRRTEPEDPSSALFESSEFIRRHTGDFRFLTSLCDRESGFYGAAFCDDAGRCVWITYSGAVSAKDMIACAALVLAPGLSSQERSAFAFYETVMDSTEVKNRSYTVILTGHSLGGALASMVSRASGCAAITINGADGVAIDKMNDILGNAPEEYRISNYMTSPDNGKFSLMDLVQRFMFLGSYKAADYHVYEENGLTDDTHCVFSFIRYADDRYQEPELPVPVEEHP